MDPGCRVAIRCVREPLRSWPFNGPSRSVPFVDRRLQASAPADAMTSMEAYGEIRQIRFEIREVRYASQEERDAEERTDGTHGQESQAGDCHRPERSTKEGRQGSETPILTLEKALAP